MENYLDVLLDVLSVPRLMFYLSVVTKMTTFDLQGKIYFFVGKQKWRPCHNQRHV